MRNNTALVLLLSTLVGACSDPPKGDEAQSDPAPEKTETPAPPGEAAEDASEEDAKEAPEAKPKGEPMEAPRPEVEADSRAEADTKEEPAPRLQPVETEEGIGGDGGLKGPIDGATVRIFAMDDDAGPGSLLATTTTRRGRYQTPLATRPAAIYTLAGGSYTAEATGAHIELGSRALEAIELGGRTASMTPLSTTHAALTRCIMREQGADLTTAHQQAMADLSDTLRFGFDTFDVLHVRAFDASADRADGLGHDVWNALLLAGVSQLAHEHAEGTSLDGMDWTRALAEDASGPGCRLDGLGPGGAVTVGPHTLSDRPLDALVDATRRFVAGPRNATGITLEQVDAFIQSGGKGSPRS